jgi:cation:H+ antiporter
MTLLLNLGMFVVGLVLLIVGAELLVRGASRIAAAVGVSSLVIGLTVVAFGTSAPELAVLVQSALAGEADIAIGNVVGSNICNVLLILGLSASVAPLIVSRQLVRFDVPVMIAACVAMWLMAQDRVIGLLDGVVLFTGFVAYTYWSLHQSRKQSREEKATNTSQGTEAAQEESIGSAAWAKNAIFFVGGLGLIVWGADWLVKSAVFIAEDVLQVPTLIVGLTVIAVGTSLPEIATSVVASLRGERDIAVGNIVGSNISNILLVLGLSSIVAPGGIGVSLDALQFDIPVMVAIVVLCMPVFFSHYEITRLEGIIFLLYYATYTIYLVLNALSHQLLAPFVTVMTIFVALTVLGLFGVALHALVTKHQPVDTSS